MNDYKKKKVQTLGFDDVTSVFKRRPYPIQYCHCLRLSLKKEIEQNFFKLRPLLANLLVEILTKGKVIRPEAL